MIYKRILFKMFYYKIGSFIISSIAAFIFTKRVFTAGIIGLITILFQSIWYYVFEIICFKRQNPDYRIVGKVDNNWIWRKIINPSLMYDEKNNENIKNIKKEVNT